MIFQNISFDDDLYDVMTAEDVDVTTEYPSVFNNDFRGCIESNVM